MSGADGWVLLTNDDGIEAPGFRRLVTALHQAGHPLVTLAPSENHSAAGMRIQLGAPMAVRSREDLRESWGLSGGAPLLLHEIDGTPCDAMIVALDGGLDHLHPGLVPRLVVSGVNLGPNLSQDFYHSGTMGAAREAGLYGMPAIAASFTSFEEPGMDHAVQATLDLVERALRVLPMRPTNLGRPTLDLSASHISTWPTVAPAAWTEGPDAAVRTAFAHGELMLNLNVGPSWNGSWRTTRLGTRWYRQAVAFSEADGEGLATFVIGAASIEQTPVDGGDCCAVDAGAASLSCLPTWPATHPLAVDDALLAEALRSDDDGWPSWLST